MIPTFIGFATGNTPLYGSSVALNSDSRFLGFPILSISGVRFFATWTSIKIPPHAQDNFFRVGPAEIRRMDIIAAKFYDDATLGWLIAMVNQVTDLIMSPQLQDVLRIPYLPAAMSYLRTQLPPPSPDQVQF